MTNQDKQIILNKFFPVLITKDRVDLLPHQVNALYGTDPGKYSFPCRRVNGLIIEDLPRGVLLADETGLGKTVILGLYLLYLKLHGYANNVLIAVPKSITFQWKEELLKKMELDFDVINHGHEFKNIYSPFNIIVSIDLLKTNKGLEFLDRDDIQIDVSIIDEAHHVLSTSPSQRYKMAKKLRYKSKLLILSTATPFRGNPKQANVIDELLGCNYLYIRRTKEDAKDFENRPLFMPRMSFTLRVEPQEWDNVYTKINALIDGLKLKNAVKLILKKRLASSVYSFLVSYYKIITNRQNEKGGLNENVLGETDDIKGKEPDENVNFKELDITNMSRIANLRDVVRLEETHLEPKEKWLISWLKQPEIENNKVIIFTEYVNTLERLHKVLQEHGIAHYVIHGKMNYDQRIENIELFKNKNKVRILIATDVAGEGLNFQFANLQINYDLPWSPLKLEQRFGRIHRYGQKKAVKLFNLYVPNTLDERIVNVLLSKLDEISKNLGDWIFDYIGDMITQDEIKNVLERKNEEINYEKRLQLVKESLASPEISDEDLTELRRYISIYSHKLREFNLQYILNNI